MTGYAKNSDFILRLDARQTGETDPYWLAVLYGFQTLGEARNDTTSEYYYLSGFGTPEQSIDGTTQSFATTGHRVYGDPLQDWLFSYDRQWNTSERYTNAQYFNTKTGEGWQGPVSIAFTSTQTGSPQERAAFGVTIAWQGTPAAYEHDLGPYSITYDANGGSGAVTDTATYAIGASAIVKAATDLTAPTGETFSAWNTREDGAGARYQPGDLITLIDDVTLYAIWGS